MSSQLTGSRKTLLQVGNQHLTFNYQKADDKIFVCEFSNIVKYKLCQIKNSKTRANSVDLDEVAHDEQAHQDLRCLQIQLFSSLVFKEFTKGLLLT